MLVLAIDTSTAAVTAGVVAVGAGRAGVRAGLDVVAERSPVAARGHGELLAPAIAECLAAAGVAPRDVDAVVAGVGPGPYTGLRVGLASAAAFADAIGAPAYGVCSLDAVALAAADEPELLVVADARRREVYWARYRRGVRATEPAVDRPDHVEAPPNGAIAGAVDLYPDAWPTLRLRTESRPDARSLVTLAERRVLEGAPSERLSPMYLRRPDAIAPGAPKPVLQ